MKAIHSKKVYICITLQSQKVQRVQNSSKLVSKFCGFALLDMPQLQCFLSKMWFFARESWEKILLNAQRRSKTWRNSPSIKYPFGDKISREGTKQTNWISDTTSPFSLTFRRFPINNLSGDFSRVLWCNCWTQETVNFRNKYAEF